MKNILFVVAALAVMTACGENAGKKAAVESRPDATECIGDHPHDHDHNKEPVAHTHEDGRPCSGEHAGHDHDAHAGHDHSHNEGSNKVADEAENPDEIVFTPAQAARTDFEVQTVTLGQFAEVIPASGQIIAAPGDEVTLVAPMPGIVSFADNTLSQGKSIGAANTLFHISSRNIDSGDALVRDANAYRKAKADFERAEKLREDKIVSQAEYEALKATYEDARAVYEALAGSVSDKGAGVKSRIAGYVTSIAVAEGDYVETGQQLAIVSQNRRLVLRAEVSQRYLDRLPNVRSANFLLPYSDKVWRLDGMGGKLLSVGRTVVTQTPLIPVTFEFDNNGQVMPGSYVDVRLLGVPQEDALTIPLTAVSEQQGLYYVYVQIDEECYMRREVRLGADDGVRVRVLSGLSEGERVVTRGAVNLKMAAASGAIPHGHEH